MGSPEFSVPSLRGLAEQYPIVGVITQPDRPAGRGRVLTPPPVKVLAQSLGIEVVQPEKLNNPLAVEALQRWSPDLIIVTAFGQILRKDILTSTRFGCVNVHASLLPRWRGAAPIQAAILHGDAVSGVTIMVMDRGIDTGAMLAQRQTPIGSAETAGQLSERLAAIGADLLLDTLPGYLAGEIQPKPQDESLAIYAPMLAKGEGLLDFSRPAIELERRVRAYQPWPGAYLIWQGQPMKVLRAQVAEQCGNAPGRRIIFQNLPAVETTSGCLIFEEVQPAGKRPMTGQEFLRGTQNWLATQPQP